MTCWVRAEITLAACRTWRFHVIRETPGWRRCPAFKRPGKSRSSATQSPIVSGVRVKAPFRRAAEEDGVVRLFGSERGVGPGRGTGALRI